MPQIGQGISQFILTMILLIIGIESAVSRISDSKFLAGKKYEIYPQVIRTCSFKILPASLTP